MSRALNRKQSAIFSNIKDINLTWDTCYQFELSPLAAKGLEMTAKSKCMEFLCCTYGTGYPDMPPDTLLKLVVDPSAFRRPVPTEEHREAV